MTHDDAKKKLILAGQVLVDEGQDDFTRGHISVRLPDDAGHFFMKPHIDLAGDVVAGTARRHSEVYIHSEVYKARADVGCVLHTHPPYTIALSASGTPLKCFSQPSALFYDALVTYDDTVNLIRTPEMGAGVAQALGRGRAALLKNHGVVVAGPSIEEVVVSALMLENAARIQMIVEASGNPGPEFSPRDVAQLQHDIGRSEQFVINFDYLVRRAQRRRQTLR
jgi:L-fuculose-phosphate aldolase